MYKLTLIKYYCASFYRETMQITLTGLPQYEVEVTIDGYTNPNQARPSCNHVTDCPYTSCCDGFNSMSFVCHRCDSFFTYCLRSVDTLRDGCPEGGNNTIRSDVNPDDASIDFSQNTVLGLDNPLVFQGINDTWNVSIIPCRFFPAIYS